MDKTLHIQVACAWLERAFIRDIVVAPGTTAVQAVEQSGLLKDLVDSDLAGVPLSSLKLGIFSKIVAAGQVLEEGDRVEIYRPLMLDPKQARRERAKRAKDC